MIQCGGNITNFLSGLSCHMEKWSALIGTRTCQKIHCKRPWQAMEPCVSLVYLSLSLDVCKLELRVPDLSSVIAAHSSLITEVRPATFSLSLCLSVSLCVSLSLPPLSPLYLSHSSLWSMPGACCSRSQCVWMCVCECDAEIMDALSCALRVSAPMPRAFLCVCVCADQIGRALIFHAVLSLNWRAVYDRGWC